MKWITREALAAKVAKGGAVAGVSWLSERVLCERGIEEEDKERVRAELGDDAAAGRLVRFCISTQARASDGHTLAMTGARLEAFRRNPRVLWQHNLWRPRIADSVVWVEDGAEPRCRAVAAFLGRDLSEALDDGFSWAMGELAARRGSAASVGFDIDEAIPADEEVRKRIPWALNVTRWTLREWSLVNLGADEHAVTEGRAAGVETEPLARAFSRMLDELAAGGVDRQVLERAWAAAAPPRPTHVDLGVRGALTGILTRQLELGAR